MISGEVSRAEANPVEAKRISKQATEFVQILGTLEVEGMQEMFNEFFERPLRYIKL